jgi:hypothetical protein
MVKKQLSILKKLVLSDKELETSINVQTNTFAQAGKLAVLPIQEIKKRY